jgi:hypothetical protein
MERGEEMQVLIFNKLQELGETRANAWWVAQRMCYPKPGCTMSPKLHKRFVLEFETGLTGKQIDTLLEEVG